MAETETREDARLIAAAANDGRIGVDSCPTWMLAMKADRAGTRRTLASLTPLRGATAGAEHAQRGVMASLARQGIRPVSKAVTASYQAPSSPRPAPVDMLGIPIPGIPEPVRISRGKDPAAWTAQERSDWFLHQLGPRFQQGVNPPPRGDGWYQPSPNDHSEFVDDGKGGYWRAKPNYQAEA